MTKDRIQIQQWLDRYMAGEATEQEERLLAEYFCTETDIPGKWGPYAIMFRGLKGLAVPVVAKHRTLRWRWAAAAAIALLTLGLGWQLGRVEQKEAVVAERITTKSVAEAPTSDFSKVSKSGTSRSFPGLSGGRSDAPSFDRAKAKQRQKKASPRPLQLEETTPLNPPNWGEVAAQKSAAGVTSKASPSWGRLEGAAEENTVALLNIDMAAVQQQGEDLRTALAIVNNEIFENE